MGRLTAVAIALMAAGMAPASAASLAQGMGKTSNVLSRRANAVRSGNGRGKAAHRAAMKKRNALRNRKAQKRAGV